MLSSLFDEAVNKIKAASSILILHDYDADGIGAALITERAIQDINRNSSVRLHAVKRKAVGPEHTPLQKDDLLIVLDYDLSNFGVLDAYRQIARDIIIIDHHVPKVKDVAILRINPHVAGHDLGSRYNTGALVYDGFKTYLNEDQTDWLAAATIIGDYTFDDHKATLVKIAEKYNVPIPSVGLDWHKTSFARFVFLCECSAAVGVDAIRELTTQLQKVHTFQEFSAFQNPYPEPEEDALTYITNYKSLATVDVENQIVWLRIESKYAITSWVANTISFDNPNMIYIVSEKENNIFKVSSRSQASDVNCAALMAAATKDIPNAFGGGHPHAAGAGVPIKDWKTFEKYIYAFLGDSEQSED